MASKEIRSGTEEYMMFTDFFKLLKKYYIVENGDEFFEEVKNSVDEFCKKYEGIPVSKHLAIAILDNLAEQATRDRRTTKKQP